jgi:hypothetical protein
MPWITLDTKNVRVPQLKNRQSRVRFLVDESLGVEAALVLQANGTQSSSATLVLSAKTTRWFSRLRGNKGG